MSGFWLLYGDEKTSDELKGVGRGVGNDVRFGFEKTKTLCFLE